MSSQRAPKQWQLSKKETPNSYESWCQKVLYSLTLDKEFAPFIFAGASWEKKTAGNLYRDLTDNGMDVVEALWRTKIQKSSTLDLILGHIATFCPIIDRETIVKTSTSLDDIWLKIRQHFGFQCFGAHFLDFVLNPL